MGWREVHRIVFRLLAAALLLSSAGCSIDDDRDVCCGNVVVEYRYLPYGVDELPTYITSMRHFVFDGDGRYVCEVGDGSNSRRQRFTLPDGDYTMVTLGNAGGSLKFDPEEQTLGTLEAELATQTRAGLYANCERTLLGSVPDARVGRGERGSRCA